MVLSFQKILILVLAITFVLPYQFPSISAESVSVLPLILSALVILIQRHGLKNYLWILFFIVIVIFLSAPPLIMGNAILFDEAVRYTFGYFQFLAVFYCVSRIRGCEIVLLERVLLLGSIAWITWAAIEYISLKTTGGTVSGNVPAGGRGLKLFAPEPSFAAVQLTFLAIALSSFGKVNVPILLVFVSVVFVGSAAALPLSIAALLYTSRALLQKHVVLIGLVGLSAFGGYIYTNIALIGESRIANFVSLSWESGIQAILKDPSAAVRVFHLVSPIELAFGNYLLPLGVVDIKELSPPTGPYNIQFMELVSGTRIMTFFSGYVLHFGFIGLFITTVMLAKCYFRSSRGGKIMGMISMGTLIAILFAPVSPSFPMLAVCLALILRRSSCQYA